MDYDRYHYHRDKDECDYGHPLEPGHPNVRVDKKGYRHCRECARIRQREYRQRQKSS